MSVGRSDPARGPDGPGGRIGALLQGVGGDRDGISTSDALGLLPRVAAALRSAVRRGPDGRSGIPVDRFREIGRVVALRLPVRDATTLIRHHKGRTGEALADALVRNAASTTATVGVVGGALVMTTRRTPQGAVVSIPLRIAAEALVVAAVEVKLVAELHEVYGRPLGLTSSERSREALRVWASYRGVDGDSGGVIGLLGRIVKAPAQRRAAGGAAGKVLGARAAMVGAGLSGGTENRRATMDLASRVRSDLRRGGIRALPGGKGTSRGG